MEPFRLGIDIGSTTAKIVLVDISERIIFSEYIRHNTRIQETLLDLLTRIQQKVGDIPVQAAFSGSTSMGIAEDTRTTFIQEIIAEASLVKKRVPEVKSLIDIGGEDAKLILFKDFRTPDIRMNGSCAGGTGAYIDQMAAMLNHSIAELDKLAWQSTKIYPIASRCGVFAKTDVQNLVSRKINLADIAASIFDAMAGQIINSLARGCLIEPRILFTGGPLTYISYLGAAFAKLLKIDRKDILIPERAELFTALGTALSIPAEAESRRISDFFQISKSARKTVSGNTLKALFLSPDHLAGWENNRRLIAIPETKAFDGETCYLGIDSGSTTTKIVIINAEGSVKFSFYRNNDGQPLETAIEGLRQFSRELAASRATVHIGGAAVTGYGEDLIKSALGIRQGVVETAAHFMAAQKIEPHVSFILDIGGQDIKAIFVQNGVISNIEINEACSSGCGSFIENFAYSLGYDPAAFADLADQSAAPYDLGSRCTVFMNSKVKQAMRDGATIPDIAAGLAYSVIKNCLNKVLRIKNAADLGDTIVVQGGTFKNKAVFRSLELLSGKKLVVSDKPELMGAYGAALYALNQSAAEGAEHSFIGLGNLDKAIAYTPRSSTCSGCTNKCQITAYRFSHGAVCYSGNKCEKIFTNNARIAHRGENIFEHKKQILFNRTGDRVSADRPRIGIPRVLNIYEDYPFWHTLLSKCGFTIEISDESSHSLYLKGIGALMSDNICFPAKLAHGHILNLIEKKVDRILLPFVIYEKKEFHASANSFNCPIVTAYSEVLKNTTLLTGSEGIAFDSPAINFENPGLLKKACRRYVERLGVGRAIFAKAFAAACFEQQSYRRQLKEKNEQILRNALKNSQPLVLIASHAYHMDQLVHQQVSHILADLGVNVINEDIAVGASLEGFKSFFCIAQWAYPNRVLQAAWWASKQDFPLGLIHLNSFGCGPDSFIMDEVRDLASRVNLPFALVRIDEILSPGSIKLRLRSLVESLKLKNQHWMNGKNIPPTHSVPAVFNERSRNKTILVPWFSDIYSPFVPVIGNYIGHKIENLSPSDRESVELGLEYANNEVCYPATLVVGDIIRALRGRKYNPDDVAIGIPQTGGQCRATNYIALVKRALSHAGFGKVPVLSLVLSKSIKNDQPGFKPKWARAIKPVLIGLLFADSLARIFYATISRALVPDSALCLRDMYVNRAITLLERNDYHRLPLLLKDAIQKFNELPVVNTDIKTVGIVGEIYVKYNAFGQFHIIDWLIQNRVEVVIPPLLEFFTQAFVNVEARTGNFVSEYKPLDFMSGLADRVASHFIGLFENILKKSRFYRPVHDIHYASQLASEILSLNNQYGEGWLIPAQIATLARQQINHVICIQPFGCIANHIIGKGMEMKIKNLYPEMNLLYLDFDSGISKVNVVNRLQFLIQNMAS